MLAEDLAETRKSTLRDCAYVGRGPPLFRDQDYLGSIVLGDDAPRRSFHHADRGVLGDYMYKFSVKAKLFSMKRVFLALLLVRGRERLEAGGHGREELHKNASRNAAREAEYAQVADYPCAVCQGWNGVNQVGVLR